MPWAWNAATSCGVNCPMKGEPPSEALMISVPMPFCLARATMLPMLPPSDFETYQSHITLVSNGELPDGPERGGLATGAGLRMATGPAGLDAVPPGTVTVNRPERASSGTVTAYAPARWRTRAVTRFLEPWTFDFRGKLATMPCLKPRPQICSLPPGCTVIGAPSAQRSR